MQLSTIQNVRTPGDLGGGGVEKFLFDICIRSGVETWLVHSIDKDMELKHSKSETIFVYVDPLYIDLILE